MKKNQQMKMVNEHLCCVLELYMRMKTNRKKESRIPFLTVQFIVIFFANGIYSFFAGVFSNECRSYNN